MQVNKQTDIKSGSWKKTGKKECKKWGRESESVK